MPVSNNNNNTKKKSGTTSSIHQSVGSSNKASGLLIILGVCIVLLFVHHSILVMWFQEQINQQQKLIDSQKMEFQTIKATMDDIILKVKKQDEEREHRYNSSNNQKNNLNDGQTKKEKKIVIQTGKEKTIQFKFPSVKERVKYYMGDWYYDIHHNRTLTSTSAKASTASPPPPPLPPDLCDRFPYWHKDQEPACCHNYLFDETNLKQHPLTMYAEDVLNYAVSIMPPSWSSPSTGTSTITNANTNTEDLSQSKFVAFMHFGDTRANNAKDLPVIFKARSINETKSIIFPLNTVRHFGLLKKIRGLDKTPWEDKTPELVWRGGNVGQRYGLRQTAVQKYAHYPEGSPIDIAFSDIAGQNPKDTNKSYLRPSVTRWMMLKKKYLLSMEGNDVASDLKWMLYSSSVVFMVPPTVSSWAMEDKLVPFYHYIPLKKDLSDIPQMMEWAKQNDAKCKLIAQQATKFMEDLWASDEAQRDNAYILSEMTSIYNEVYGKAIGKCKK